jgi:hypothetical protein
MAEGGEPSSSTTPLTFQNFLEKMRHPSASELVKSVKSFISSFGSGGVVDAETDSARIQEFLAVTEAAFRGHPAWRGASDDELDASGEGLEKYLMTKLHPSTFAVTIGDKRADKHLTRRVAALRTFIRPEHLDIPAHFRVETSWRLAEDELAKVNHFKAPRDKLVCVLNTCRIVNNVLNTASGLKPAGADDFLPVLIYVVLRANPPFLESNLRYISRFRRESRLVSEAAYFYTNLVSAARFLATCDHEAFTNLDADVFEAHMLAEGVDPKHAPEDVLLQDLETGPFEVGDAREGREGARTGDSSNAAVSDDSFSARRDLETARLELEALASEKRKFLERYKTVDDVEVEGAARLAAEDAAGSLRLPHAFAYARADDLQIGEISELLRAYKGLAVRYEALRRGTRAALGELSADDSYGVGAGSRETGGDVPNAQRREETRSRVANLEGSAVSSAEADRTEDSLGAPAVGGASDASDARETAGFRGTRVGA